MSYIINYASGGIGNRLKPLGSCYNISLKTCRKLGMTWDKTMACYAEFNSLYKNSIDIIDLQQLDYKDVSIYAEPDRIEHDVNLNKIPHLYNLFSKIGCTSLVRINEILNDTHKYVIVYDNTFLLGYESISDFIKSLIPSDDIQDKISSFIDNFKIDKNVVGVHARGTDFIAANAQMYISQMKNFTGSFYVCSDSKEIEDQIKQVFGDRVIIREKRYVQRINNNMGWVNNLIRTEDSVKDAVIDLVLLSKTNFQVFNKDSTFAEIAKLLQ